MILLVGFDDDGHFFAYPFDTIDQKVAAYLKVIRSRENPADLPDRIRAAFESNDADDLTDLEDMLESHYEFSLGRGQCEEVALRLES